MRSDDSIPSTAASASPRVADRTVLLGSTPPLAALTAVAALPHQPAPPASRSACSSRSATPKGTPQAGPAPDPHAVGLAPRVPFPSTHRIAASAGAAGASHASASGAVSPAAGGLCSSGASSFGEGALRRSGAPSCSPGQFDDLSDLWMRRPPADWASRRSVSLGSTEHSRGSCSRSLSPVDAEDGPRRRPSSSGFEGLDGMPQAEICLLGMTDDEEEGNDADDVDSGDDIEKNVVASALQEGRGGGAFVAHSRSSVGLHLVGLDAEADAPCSPPARVMSPLIAQLNPFNDLDALSLPPAATDGPSFLEEAIGVEVSPVSGAAGSNAASARLAGSKAEEPGDCRPDVQHLLVEMGDLVCKLQQRRDLALASQEASPEELLERLAHFRDVAQTMCARH